MGFSAAAVTVHQAGRTMAQDPIPSSVPGTGRRGVMLMNRIGPSASLKERLQQLARVRSEEGYMAEVRPDGSGGFLFIENHCPICAAATACQGFCTTELDLFRTVLGPGASVERTEHIISGDRRCVYKVRPATS